MKSKYESKFDRPKMNKGTGAGFKGKLSKGDWVIWGLTNKVYIYLGPKGIQGAYLQNVETGEETSTNDIMTLTKTKRGKSKK